jgi:hypothetical protein
MASRHLLIAGTGRAGTTALVELFGACGLETGAEELRFFKGTRAGLERTFVGDGSPYVVKHPYISEYLEDLVADGFDPARIDAVVVPVRDLRDSAASRIQVFADYGLRAPGGLWRSRRPGRQLTALAESEHRLLRTVAGNHIPLVLLNFPEFVNDADYAWRQLRPVLTSVDAATFAEQHAALMQPRLVSAPRYPGWLRMARLDIRWVLQNVRDRVIRRRKRPPQTRR